MRITEHRLPAYTSSSISLDSIQLSIQNIVKHWTTRQRYWNPFFGADQEQRRLSNTTPPWRRKLASFLESMPLRVTVIILLILDITLTILDLSSSMLKCHNRGDGRSLAADWFHWVEIGILSLLCAKLIALAVALGPKAFFSRPGYVVDGVVVVGALVLEGLLDMKEGGLMVVVSLWRVVRVVESAFELSDEAIEAQIARVVLEFEALKAENIRLLETIGERDETIRMLQEMVEMLKAELDDEQ
ncbi:unnamed protein product [Linum tenue]|uniref:Voltage-gated hydrogen channel 1 n=2 Tax=Linum tenue TaxID=586396 RepID=A0AAV0N3P9_9ROSI|nr:unnamed protein product [Linum tenue]